MLSSVKFYVVTLLALISSVYAELPEIEILENGHATMTASNSTYLSVAKELGIEVLTAAAHSTPLYGGGGGRAFDSGRGSVKSIRIRSGSLIDSIQLVFRNGKVSRVYGGKGGSPSTIDLARHEFVTAIIGKGGRYVDSLLFVTNRGRVYGRYGGNGGGAFTVSSCKLQGIFGRSGSLIDAIGFHCA